MRWPNPFSKTIDEVVSLTFPPADAALEPGPEAVAVGLMMRARMLLHAQAILSDRILAGATDPLVRATLEACFTGTWVLADGDAYQKYVGHHRRKWRIIAEELLGDSKEASPQVRSQLEPFLNKASKDLPPEASVPSFEEQARVGGLKDFYPTYRMVTRRAHPDLDAARTGLRGPVAGVFYPNTSPISTALGDPYIRTGVYVVARLGTLVFERLGWEGADKLEGLLARSTDQARAESEQARDALTEIEPPSRPTDPETTIGG